MSNFFWDVREKLYHIFRYRFPLNFIIQQEKVRIERLLNSIAMTGKKYIDLGTGNGNALNLFKNARCSFGLDRTFSMLRRAQRSHPDVPLIQADASHLPLQNNSMEIVSAIGLSEYIKDIELLLIEVNQILKDNGILLLTFSPPGFWIPIRWLFGNRVYPRTMEHINLAAKQTGFLIVKTEHSFMQWQVLLRKT